MGFIAPISHVRYDPSPREASTGQSPSANEPVSDLLLFHHIPKTAGTALVSVLRGNYHPTELLSLYGPEAWSQAALLAEQGVPASVKCLATHATEVLVPGLRSFRAFTLLRDPVDRMASAYQHSLSLADKNVHGGGQIGREIRRLGWALEDIYRNLAGGTETSSERHRLFSVFFNGQTRHLLSPYHSTADLRFDEGRPADTRPYVERLQIELERRYTLGTREQFERSVGLFLRRFGWSHLVYPRQRVTHPPPTDQLSAEVRSLVRRYNELDAHLHERVTEHVQRMDHSGLSNDPGERHTSS
jgi:hypothetical protein